MDPRQRHTVLLLIALGNFAQVAVRLVISPVVPDIIATFAASTSTIGLALTGMWAVYALMQFPSGVFGDRFGERTVVLVSLGLMTAGSVLLSLSPSFLTFGLFALFLGAGTGLYFPLAVTLVSKLYDRRGRPLGVLTAGGALAGLIAPIVGALIGARYGWRPAILFGAAVSLPTLGLFYLKVEHHAANPDISIRDRVAPHRLLALLKSRQLLYTTAVAASGTFAFQSISSFIPTFLVEFQGLSTELAGTGFGALFLLSTIAQPVMGNLADRFPRDTVLAATMLTTATGLIVLVNQATLLSVIIGIGVIGIGLSWFPAVMDRFMAAIPETDRNVGFGLVRTLYMLFGSLGSVITGTLADTAGWPTAFALIATLLGIAVISLIANHRLQLGL